MDVFHLNNFSTLSGELFTFLNLEAHSNIITEFIDYFCDWSKLIVVCRKEFKIFRDQELWNNVTLAINFTSSVACIQ